MDPSMIQMLLSKMRGTPTPVSPTAQPTPTQNPLMLDPSLEAQAQDDGQTQLHPAVAAIMQKMGLMNMLRNRANQQMTAGDING